MLAGGIDGSGALPQLKAINFLVVAFVTGPMKTIPHELNRYMYQQTLGQLPNISFLSLLLTQL